MLINANSLSIPLADDSVHCVITSPPYFHQRSYLTAKWTGGREDCTHESARHKNRFDYPVNEKQLSNAGSGYSEWEDICPDCGAERTDNQIGQEDVPDCFGWATGNPCGVCFTCQLVNVFREVRRVMRPDATLWLNLGDTYAGSGGAGGDYNSNGNRDGQERYKGTQNINGFKDKDFLLVPHSVAMALRADGWWLRASIPWVKKNAYVDGGARDRPATKVEYVFMLTKSKNYYYDRFATLVEYTEPLNRWGGAVSNNSKSGWAETTGDKLNRHRHMRPSDKGRLRRPSDWFYDSLREVINGENGLLLDEDMMPMAVSVKTQPSNIPHYATFPVALVKPFILSSTSEEGCCNLCKRPLERNVDANYKTLGWKKTCDCEAETEPCVVLDPFCGVSTTGIASSELGRRFVGIDLSSEYLVLGKKRLEEQVLPLFRI